MKKIIFVSAILLAMNTANAQKSNINFAGGIDVGIPAHNLSGSSLSAGVDLMALYHMSKEAALTGDAGISALFGKNGATTSTLIPLRIGLRYYPSSNFFAAGKIGVGFISNNSSYVTSVTTTAYSFGIGYAINPKVEIGASYDGYSKNGTIGLVNVRLAYSFN